MFVTNSDYNQIPYTIPNVDTLTDFNAFAALAEQDCLRGNGGQGGVLGMALYDEFVAALASLPDVWNIGSTYNTDDEVVYGLSVWKSKVDNNTGNAPAEGVNWTAVSLNDKWLRLRDGDTYTYNNKDYKYGGIKDFIKPFVYAAWVRENADTLTANGVVTPQVENSDWQGTAERVIGAENEFARKVGADGDYRHTLFGFLYSQKDDLYPDWVWTSPGYINFLGI